MKTYLRFLVVENYILKFEIKPLGTNLRFFYSINNVKNKNILEVVKNSFENNPEDENIFNTLSVDVEYSNNLSLIQTSDLKQFLIIEKNKATGLYRKFKFGNLTLSLKISQIEIIVSFIDFFINNYENIKSSFVKKEEKNEIEIIKVDEEIDIFSIISSNIVKYYIYKFILNKNPIFEKQEVDNNITIKITSPIDFKNFSNAYLSDIILILNNIKSNKEDCMNKISFLFSKLIKSINSNSINEIRIELFLMYLFSFLVIKENKVMEIQKVNIEKSFNEIIKFILNYYIKKNGYKNTLNFVLINEENNNDERNFSEIEKKYEYLLSLDESSYRESIFKEFKMLPTNISNTENNRNISLSNSKIYYIDESKNIQDLKFENFKINSNEFHTFLKIKKYGTNIVKSDVQIINLYYQIFDELIFPKIDENIESIKLSPNILTILELYINPFINETTSLTTRYKIIFKVILPYIYNKYNIKEYINYFF